MPNATKIDRTREKSRERTDLCQQYRPIGIGAVAAALAATGKSDEDQHRPRSAANSNERIGADGSRAA